MQVVAVCDVNRESAGYWDGKVGGREPARKAGRETLCRAQAIGHVSGLRRRTSTSGRSWAEGHRRRRGLHAGPLACDSRARGLQGRQGHLLPEAAVADDRRGPGDELRGEQAPRRFPDGQPAAVGPSFPAGVRAGAQWPDRRPEDGPRGPARRPARLAKCGDRKKPEPVPAGFEYNTWLGPAPDAPYAPARCHVNFRWILDYSGGQVTDWGGHHPDCAQWGMGTELTGPIELRNVKGEFPPDPLWNTATEFSFEAVYENGVVMIISNKNKVGSDLRGHRRVRSMSTAASTRPTRNRSSTRRSARARSTSTRATITSATSSIA